MWKTEMAPEEIMKYKVLAMYMKENPIEGVSMTTKAGLEIYRRTMMEKLGETEPDRAMDIEYPPLASASLPGRKRLEVADKMEEDIIGYSGEEDEGAKLAD